MATSSVCLLILGPPDSEHADHFVLSKATDAVYGEHISHRCVTVPVDTMAGGGFRGHVFMPSGDIGLQDMILILWLVHNQWAAKCHIVEGDTAEWHTVEGDTAEWHTVEGDTAEWHIVEGHTSECHIVEGDTAKWHIVEGHTAKWHTVEGDTAECQTVEGDTHLL